MQIQKMEQIKPTERKLLSILDTLGYETRSVEKFFSKARGYEKAYVLTSKMLMNIIKMAEYWKPYLNEGEDISPLILFCIKSKMKNNVCGLSNNESNLTYVGNYVKVSKERIVSPDVYARITMHVNGSVSIMQNKGRVVTWLD